MKQFIKCLLASADYDSFYRVMAREGRNLRDLREIEMDSKSSADDYTDSKLSAESKDVESYSSESDAKISSNYDSKSDYK